MRDPEWQYLLDLARKGDEATAKEYLREMSDAEQYALQSAVCLLDIWIDDVAMGETQEEVGSTPCYPQVREGKRRDE
jgi:hypothetical protein